MKRKPRFLVAIASAIITFSVLFATVGRPKHFDRHHFQTECSKVNETHDSSK